MRYGMWEKVHALPKIPYIPLDFSGKNSLTEISVRNSDRK